MKVVAVVHATGLLGKELCERLEQRPDLCREVRLLSSDEAEIGRLTEAAGAAAVVSRIDEAALAGVELAFLCGSIEADRPVLDRLPSGVPAVLLSRGATLDDGPAAVAGVRDAAFAGLERAVSPPPAAVALVRLLAALSGFSPTRAEATALLPVSDLDTAGIDALFEETRGILAFSGERRKGPFAAQIAFNLLPASDDAEETGRLAQDALGGSTPVSLQLGRGGVFHGLLLSLHVELDASATARQVRSALGRAPGIELARHPETVGPVAAAGVDRLLVGAVRPGSRPGAFWIWAALDNLVVGGAENALGVAEAMLAGGPPS